MTFEEALQKKINDSLDTAITQGLFKVVSETIGHIDHYGPPSRSFPPIQEAIHKAIEKNGPRIQAILDTAITKVLNQETFVLDFEQRIQTKLINKILEKTESEFDKKIQELRQDASFRARVTLALADVLKDYSANKNSMPSKS